VSVPEAAAVDGRVAPGWEGVRDAFLANFTHGRDTGAACAVYHRGTPVVDLWGGSWDDEGSVPYAEDTLQLVFSTTKGITAIAVAMCVERGLLSYDQPVAEVWPEFAASGKGAITVAELLSHRAGLPTIDRRLSLAEVLDWTTITGALAAQAPFWPAGEKHGYHALTYGWLAGELVRRVDPGHRSLGRFVAEEIAAPLGAEVYIGLPADLEPRVAPLIPWPAPPPEVRAMLDAVMGPDTLAGRALSLNGAFEVEGDDVAWNTRAVHAAEVPAANAIATARGLARVYAATIGEVDGERLLHDATVDRARTRVTTGNDACLVVETTFGMGFMTSGPFIPMLGPGSFGHLGAGGSAACALPEADLAFAFMMNRMDMNLLGDLRAADLMTASLAAASRA
jgi:CubicO group peptidase (beta-lactamase class C family)